MQWMLLQGENMVREAYIMKELQVLEKTALCKKKCSPYITGV
jgi:hypothetical protein